MCSCNNRKRTCQPSRRSAGVGGSSAESFRRRLEIIGRVPSTVTERTQQRRRVEAKGSCAPFSREIFEGPLALLGPYLAAQPVRLLRCV
jgi:hypothetical protein